jgi:antitoxin component of MazEF toxin-antitoxin module
MHVTTELTATGGSTTGIRIPDDVVSALDAGNRPKVVAMVNGHSWRTSIARMGGEFWLGVSAENRAAAGLTAGDEVELDVELDDSPRTVEVPDDLAAALAGDPAAAAAWGSLSYSHQRRHILAIEGAKAAETRQRRIAAALATLTD